MNKKNYHINFDLKMKPILTILFIAFLSVTATFAQVTRTTTQTITTSNVNTINLDLNAAEVELVETKGSRIIVEARISLENISNLSLLEFLINSGRYDIIKKMDNSTSTLNLSRKKSKNALIVKGVECKEVIKYKILVPTSVKFVNTNNSTASTNS